MCSHGPQPDPGQSGFLPGGQRSAVEEPVLPPPVSDLADFFGADNAGLNFQNANICNLSRYGN